MAVFSSYADFGALKPSSTRQNSKSREIAAYIGVALVAMAVAIPAAIATAGVGDAGLFTECFSQSCENSDTLALLNK